MSSFFRVKIENDTLILNVSHLEPVIAGSGKNERTFKNTKGTVTIPLNELKYLLASNQSDRIIFSYPASTPEDKNKRIAIGDDTLFFADSNMTIDFDGQHYVFYMDAQKRFTCRVNFLPAPIAYYRCNRLKILRKKEGLHIEIELTTEFLKAEKVEFVIINRKTGEDIVTLGTIISCEKQQNEYRQTVQAVVDFKALNSLIASDDNTMKTDRLVIQIRIEYMESPIKAKSIGIVHPLDDEMDVDEEIWVKNTQGEINGFFPRYSQSHFAFMSATTLSQQTYEAYINFNPEARPKNDKKIFIVSEYPMKAQDNGFHFFKYVNDFHYAEIDCYYVISEHSDDLANLADYKDKILIIKSPKHIEKLLQADILAHAHADYHLYPFISKSIYRKIRAKRVFLQHGILGVRNLSNIYGKDAHSFKTDYFIVSSEREKQLVIDEFGYSNNQVLLTGLPRFDNLMRQKKKSRNEKTHILIMPTWRREITTEEEFVSSDFYQKYRELITSSEFSKLIKDHSLKVRLFLHSNFQVYTKYFSSNDIEILDDRHNIQTLLKESDLLITDYSSVGLDFAVTKKRIIYYQFDSGSEEGREDDFEKFLPGDIVHTQDEVIHEVHKFIKSNRKIKLKHALKLKSLFLFNDTNSNKRLMNEIMKLINH